MNLSKNEERAILEKIKGIIEEAGKDSYIGISFEGIIEMATENIDNDFSDSLTSYKAAAERAASEKQATIAKLKEIKEAADKQQAEFDKLIEINNKLCEEVNSYAVNNAALRKSTEQAQIRAADKERENKAMSAETTKLKAKLYDYMTV